MSPDEWYGATSVTRADGRPDVSDSFKTRLTRRGTISAGGKHDVRLTVFTLFVNDQDQALRFYVGRLGFVVSEDNRMGDYRWLLVRAPETQDVAINLEARPHAGPAGPRWESGRWQTLFALATDNCRRDFQAMTARASP